MKFIRLSLAILTIYALAFGAEDKSQLNVNGNLAISSNSIWRGMTQTENSPVVNGEISLDYKNFYLGVTASNTKSKDIKARSEFDIFGGYSSEIYGFEYDIGAIKYIYPNSTNEASFADIYLSVNREFETFTIGTKFYRGIKTNECEVSNALEVIVELFLPMNISFDALYGNYNHMGDYYSIGFAKTINENFKVSLSYMGIDKDVDDENNVVATVSASF